MAEITYYDIQYGGKKYSAADVTDLLDAIKNGGSSAKIMTTGSGKGLVEVTLALGGIPVAVEKRQRTDKPQKTMIL